MAKIISMTEFTGKVESYCRNIDPIRKQAILKILPRFIGGNQVVLENVEWLDCIGYSINLDDFTSNWFPYNRRLTKHCKDSLKRKNTTFGYHNAFIIEVYFEYDKTNGYTAQIMIYQYEFNSLETNKDNNYHVKSAFSIKISKTPEDDTIFENEYERVEKEDSKTGRKYHMMKDVPGYTIDISTLMDTIDKNSKIIRIFDNPQFYYINHLYPYLVKYAMKHLRLLDRSIEGSGFILESINPDDSGFCLWTPKPCRDIDYCVRDMQSMEQNVIIVATYEKEVDGKQTCVLTIFEHTLDGYERMNIRLPLVDNPELYIYKGEMNNEKD